jgi:hypothetical protein
MRSSLALLAVALLAGCGGHQLAACSGPTFALAGPAGAAEAAAPVSASRPALPARKPANEPTDPFAPRGGSMVFQKADAR